VPARGPFGGPCCRTPPRVTSCRVHTWEVRPGPAVRDPRTRWGEDGAAARPGGDVGRRDQVAVPGVPAMRAGEYTSDGFRHPTGTRRAGRGGATLIDQRDSYPGYLGLVAQRGDQIADAPGVHSLVMSPPCVQAENAARVADCQRADPVPGSPVDQDLGGLVLRLPDPPLVSGRRLSLAAAVSPPAPRPALPGLGCSPTSDAGAGLRVAQVLTALGADRAPRHQQQLPVRPGCGIRVNDPQVDPGQPVRIRCLFFRVSGDRYLCSHIDPEPASLAKQGDRPDLVRWVRWVSVQPHYNGRAASRCRQPQHSPPQPERARIPADRDQRPPTPREPCGLVSFLAAFRRDEPGVGIPA
jgi:hypothetical protein